MRRSRFPRHGSVFVAALLLVSVCGQRSVGQETETFESIFGEREVESRPIPAPVLIDGREVGIASVYPPGTTEDGPRISTVDLVSLLDELVNEDVSDALSGLAKREEYVGETELIPFGITLEFDASRLVLHVRIPGRIRPNVRISVGPGRVVRDETINPASLSAFLNVITSAQLVSTLDEVRVPVALTLEPLLSYSGYHLEASVRVDHNDDWAFTPAYVRLVKDFPASALRVSVGDTLFEATGFQARVPLQGVAVDRVFTANPSLDPRPQTMQQIVLEHPSTVTVSINGRTTYESTLPAGTYDVADFALATGLNTVEITVALPDGSTETFVLDTTFDAELLGRGVHDYSFAVGIPPLRLDVPRLSGFHRMGLTDGLTAGVNVQTDFASVTAGIESLWAAPIGVFRADIAGSLAPGTLGGAFGLRYQFRRPGSRTVPSIGALLQYEGPEFRSLAGGEGVGAVYHGRVAVSHRVSSAIGGNVALSAVAAEDFTEFTPGISIALTGSLSLGTTASLSLNLDFPQGKEPAWEARVRLSSSPVAGGVSVGVSQDLRRGVAGVQMQLPPRSPTRSIGVSSSLTGNPGDPTGPTSLSAAGKYTGYRFGGNVAGRLSRLPTGGTQALLSAQLGSAVAFAGGAFALSRPIGGPFVIVDRLPKYRPFLVGVNPQRGRYAAIADGFGPAVLPNLAAYGPARVDAESKALPIGYDLGRSSYDLLPGYAGGYRITVGTSATVFASGVLVDETGDPIALSGGRLSSQETESEHEFFTNREGRFRVYGLSPGIYRLSIAGGTSAAVIIPRDAEGEVELGTVRAEGGGP